MAERDHTTQAEQELLARLDRAFAHQRDLDPALLASIHAWQRTDRTYELVQTLVRGSGVGRLSWAEISFARRVRAHLAAAIASGRMPFETIVYRGVRDLRRSLTVATPGEAIGGRFPLRGYSAATAIKAVATTEFTRSSGAVLEIVVPIGTPALWVAGVGYPTLRRQGELLLPDKTELYVYGLSWEILSQCSQQRSWLDDEVQQVCRWRRVHSSRLGLDALHDIPAARQDRHDRCS
jgi:hypothetical protein